MPQINLFKLNFGFRFLIDQKHNEIKCICFQAFIYLCMYNFKAKYYRV